MEKDALVKEVYVKGLPRSAYITVWRMVRTAKLLREARKIENGGGYMEVEK